jgi:ATP-dependent DNA helicase RecG
LLLAEEVANETDTELDIRNIGVLMFAEHPEKYIPGACIELIKFNTEEAEASDDFIEKTFTGPIWKQVQDALDYIKTNVIEEKVVKITGKAEAERFFNYPYNALEEALVNAVFHKSYREAEPVEIRIYVDSIQIINYPGLAKWINLDRFKEGKLRGRKYRNRRIGELFKEIDLSEKKGTGIPKILRELAINGSPEVEFEMDNDRTYLNTIIHIHDGFEGTSVILKENETSFETSLKQVLKQKDFEKLYPIIEVINREKQITIQQIMELTHKSRTTAWRYMKVLEDVGVVESDGNTNNTAYKYKI